MKTVRIAGSLLPGLLSRGTTIEQAGDRCRKIRIDHGLDPGSRMLTAEYDSERDLLVLGLESEEDEEVEIEIVGEAPGTEL